MADHLNTPRTTTSQNTNSPVNNRFGVQLTGDDAQRADTADRIAQALDNAFRIPGTRITFGWDSVVGLVPVVGDALALAPSLYILKLAYDADASKPLLARMAANIGLDWIVGLIPFLGDAFDVGYKANLRNAVHLRAHLEAKRLTGPAFRRRQHSFHAIPAE